MPLFVNTLPFNKLTIGCASALFLFASPMVAKVQAGDFGHDVAFTFDLSTKDHWSDSDSGKSDHDSFDFSFNKCGGSFGFDGGSYGDWDSGKDRHHDDFFGFTGKDKDGKHDSGWQGFGDCPPPDPRCWNWGQGGNGCSGGDPNGGGSPAAPEPGASYLSLIAAGAMALLLVGRKARQRTPARRG